MKQFLVTLGICCILAACASEQKGIRVSRDASPKLEPAKPVEARTEPIFYNGKTYTLAYAPAGQGSYSVAVRGMSGAQQKDATNIATSAIRYFACPDGKTGKLVEKPRYVENEWRMTTRCG